MHWCIEFSRATSGSQNRIAFSRALNTLPALPFASILNLSVTEQEIISVVLIRAKCVFLQLFHLAQTKKHVPMTELLASLFLQVIA